MNMHTRRSFLALAGGSALVCQRVSAAISGSPGMPLLSCGAAMLATPEIKRVESDISFEQAYMDTTPLYHGNALLLTELAIDDLVDERLIGIAEQITESHPENLELMADFREEIFDNRESEEPTHEKMLIAMGGMESCTDESHMNYLDAEWVTKTYTEHDDPELAYTSMLVLLMEMENHQHLAGVELADYDALRSFCEELLEEQLVMVTELKEIRGELITRY